MSSIALEGAGTPERIGARRRSISSTGSTIHGSDATVSPPNEYQYSSAGMPSHPLRTTSQGLRSRRSEHGAVALAVEGATLAVIPAEAFRRLTKKFPKASAHIVQGQFSAYDCDG